MADLHWPPPEGAAEAAEPMRIALPPEGSPLVDLGCSESELLVAVMHTLTSLCGAARLRPHPDLLRAMNRVVEHLVRHQQRAAEARARVRRGTA